MISKSKRGGAVKKAPPGFYTAKEARTRLGVTQSAFQTLVNKGIIERVVPPLRTEGFYRIEDIHRLADQQALFYLQNESIEKYENTEFARATESDIEGIFNVVASLWGVDQATPIELRKSWYRANDKMDYVVKFRSLVLGYISIAPYRPSILEDMMAGRKRGWDIRAHDILPFEPSKSYDVFVGIVVRQDIPGHEYYAKRLIYGFFGALCDLAREGILIRRMYATSDQPFGIKISQDLGFEKQPAQPGDLFIRFVLDMETANSIVVRKYREAMQQPDKHPGQVVSRKIIYDPYLEEVLQNALEVLITTDTTRSPQLIGTLLALLDQLAESPQMTMTQQVLLRSIHEVLSQREEGG